MARRFRDENKSFVKGFLHKIILNWWVKILTAI